MRTSLSFLAGLFALSLACLGCEDEVITSGGEAPPPPPPRGAAAPKVVADAGADDAAKKIEFQEQDFVETERNRDPFRSFASTFADTAAILENLDMVISVDTSVVHLAGAMAKPVWALLPLVPDWRWMLGRHDSPWYPTLRLYRQPRLGDWGAVITEVRAHLRAIVARRRPVLI